MRSVVMVPPAKVKVPETSIDALPGEFSQPASSKNGITASKQLSVTFQVPSGSPPQAVMSSHTPSVGSAVPPVPPFPAVPLEPPFDELPPVPLPTPLPPVSSSSSENSLLSPPQATAKPPTAATKHSQPKSPRFIRV